MDLRTIDRLLSSDKKAEFLSYIKRASLVTSGNSLKLRIGDSARFCPYDILEWICTYHAVKCGTALVEGNPDLKLDLNVYNKRGAYPLHMGAYSLCPGLTELFLRHGAQANVRCPAVKSEMYGLLPLHVALERVSAQISLTQWTTRHSIFKLIILLCLPEMKEALETSRLLAWNTCTKDFKEVICSYAKEGKLIELATLILVAQKNVMGPITVRSNDGLHLKEYMRFHQWVKSELAALIDQEYTLMGLKKEKKSIRMCKKKKVAMMSTLLLVEIFEKAGDPIEAYLQSKKKSKKNVPKERVALKISLLLAEAGFKLNCKDVDLSDRFDSWPTKLILERSGGPFRGDKEHSDIEKRKKCDSQQDDICKQLHLSPGSSHNTDLCFSPSCNDGRSSQRDEDIGSNVEYNEIVELIARDDADKFVSLLKSQLEKENSDNGNSNFCQRELIMCICHYRAVKCADGLIGGATGQTMDLNVPLKDGSYPLHHAAQSLSLHLIYLFINKGADINLRCNEVGSKFYRLLPLDVALEQIRNHVEWTPKQSIFRLIFDICDLKLNGFLGIVRWLGFGVDEDDVLYHYAKEGKLIHFVTMLMAAQGFCLHPNEDGYNLDGSISLRQLISSDIASIGPEYMLQGRRSRKHAQMLREKKTVTSSVMLLLEIFRRINHIRSDILWNHLTFARPRVSSAEVAVCLKNEGYSLTDEDVNYLERNALAATPFYSSGLGKFRAETKERQLPSHLCRKPKANRGMLIEQQRSISTCSLHVKPGLSSLVQSFQTSQSFKFSVGFELCTTMEAQVKKTCQTTERDLPNIMAIKKWSSFALAMKKGLRHL